MVKIMSTTEFIQKSKLIHEDKYNYNQVVYVNTKTKVIIICAIHGKFLMTPNKHLIKKQGCKFCGYTNSSQQQSKGKEQFIKDSCAIHGIFYDYSQVVYVNSQTNVIIICPIHGEFLMVPNNHTHHTNSQGCPKCGIIARNESLRLPWTTIHERCINIYGNTYDYTETSKVYVDTKTYVPIKCNTCKKVFTKTMQDHIHNKQGCTHCECSRSEGICREIFEEIFGIPFPTRHPQFLRTIGKLELDGYNEEYNIAFEYQGIQHYEYNKYFHKGDEKNWEAQQERDIRKKELCSQNETILFEIPKEYTYKDRDAMFEYIVTLVINHIEEYLYVTPKYSAMNKNT